jgi:hypothetical protein
LPALTRQWQKRKERVNAHHLFIKQLFFYGKTKDHFCEEAAKIAISRPAQRRALQQTIALAGTGKSE